MNIGRTGSGPLQPRRRSGAQADASGGRKRRVPCSRSSVHPTAAAPPVDAGSAERDTVSRLIAHAHCLGFGLEAKSYVICAGVSRPRQAAVRDSRAFTRTCGVSCRGVKTAQIQSGLMRRIRAASGGDTPAQAAGAAPRATLGPCTGMGCTPPRHLQRGGEGHEI